MELNFKRGVFAAAPAPKLPRRRILTARGSERWIPAPSNSHPLQNRQHRGRTHRPDAKPGPGLHVDSRLSCHTKRRHTHHRNQAIGVVFAGKIAPDLATIDGTFTQMGNPLPLVIKRVKDQSELERRRPQNPVKPYPIAKKKSPTPAWPRQHARATLAIPTGNGPFPASCSSRLRAKRPRRKPARPQALSRFIGLSYP